MQNFFYKSSTDYIWEDNSYVAIEPQGKYAIRLIANRGGLISLSNQLKEFANSDDSSVCYETWPGDLEDGSLNLEIVKSERRGRRLG